MYFRGHLLFMRILGIPIEPLSLDTNVILRYLYYCYCFVFIIFFGIGFMITEGVEVLLSNWDDIDRVTGGLSYFFTHLLGSIKICTVVLKRGSIWKLIQILEHEVMLPNPKRAGKIETKIMQNCTKKVNQQIYFFNIIVVLIVLNRFLFAISGKSAYFEARRLNQTLEVKPPMPFASWFPFDINVTPYYHIAFLYSCICPWMFGFYIGEIDGLLTGFLIYIKGEFLILKETLKIYSEQAKEDYVALGGRIEDPLKNLKRRKWAQNLELIEKLPEGVQVHALQKVRALVIHHQKIIELCDKVEESFNFLMLLQFISSLMMLCIILFQLSVSDPTSYKALSMMAYLALMLFQLLIYCWNGTEVILQSTSVSDAVFGSNWLVLNDDIKKFFVLMMLRSQRPIQFTAGKFAFLSIQTYVSILRGSASYFMVLRQTQRV